MKRLLFILLNILMSLQIYSQESMNLNGKWQFALAKTTQDADKLSDFYTPEFKKDSFVPIQVPSNWAVLGFEEPVYRGFSKNKASEGFYLREFTLPKGWDNKRVLLHFGGVWSSAEVWLNGNYIGQHNSGFTSFSFDITSRLDKKKTNTLAVRVRQVSREYKFDVFDDWSIGGIYRDVTLEAMPNKRWMDNVIVRTTFDSQYKDADLNIKTMVCDKNKQTLPGNYPSPGKPYDLLFTLTDKDGKQVANRRLTVPAHIATDREVSLTMHVEEPLHWTAETPNLYNLKIELQEEGVTTHTREQRVGFRQISTEGGVFRINGQAVKLRGVNRHDEHPDVGRATTREQWVQDIKLMKEANINYIRMAHYAHAKGFIELCDEMGMYLGCEVSLGGADNLIHDPSFASAAFNRTYETVERDINSPSVIYWSIGNEDPLTTLHLASAKIAKAIDTTRPVLIPWRSEEWLPDEIDILSSHYWQPDEYDKFLGHATRPFISTEYTHAYGVDGFGGLEARWKSIIKHPAGAGAAIWMWADQGLKTPVVNPKGKNKINKDDDYLRIDDEGWDGIVDSYRRLTRDYFEAQAVYAQVYPTVGKLSVTPGEKFLNVPIQNEFDFTNLNTVKISWSVMEDEKILDSGSTSIAGEPHAVAILKLPVSKVKVFVPGKTYYVQFTFSRADGTEICKKAVELEPLQQQEISSVVTSDIMVKKDKNVVVRVGNASYSFDSQTGQLSYAMLRSDTVITDLRPTIWRTLDMSEVNVIGRKNVRNAPNLNKYTSAVESWNVEESNNAVTIRAKVKYTVDDKNSFVTDYCYTVGNDGVLRVRYEILPSVKISCVPIVGMALQTVPELKTTHWLGLGPYDAYPNKQSAPILGVWGSNDGDCFGNKATRWIDRSGAIGKVRIYSVGYMNCTKNNQNTVNILSDVLSRPEKSRKADDSFPQLRTNNDEPFIGEFKIELQ